MLFVLVTLPGLEGLTASLAWDKGLVARPLKCRARVLVEACEDDIDKLLSIGSVEAVYKLLEKFEIPRGSEWRREFRRIVRRVLSRLQGKFLVKGDCVFVHTVCFSCGLTWRKLREYAKIVAREAQRILRLNPVARPGGKSCLILRLEACREEFMLGVELARNLHRRHYLQESIPALLNPIAAYAVIAYSVRKGDVVADLYAGGATLAIEAALDRAKYAVAIEISRGILLRAIRHVRNARVDHIVDLVEADARRPPLRKGVVCVADPPRGRRVSGVFNPDAYREICKRLAAILPRGRHVDAGERVCNVLTGWGWLSINLYLFEDSL